MRYKYSYRLITFGQYEQVKEEIKEPRPHGYYWVKYQDVWYVAEWSDYWIFLGDIALYKDDHFDKIYEEPIREPQI